MDRAGTGEKHKHMQSRSYTWVVISVIIILAGLYLIASDDISTVSGTLERFSCTSGPDSDDYLGIRLVNDNNYYETSNSNCNEYRDRLVEGSKVVMQIDLLKDIMELKLDDEQLYMYNGDGWGVGTGIGATAIFIGVIFIIAWFIDDRYDTSDYGP